VATQGAESAVHDCLVVAGGGVQVLIMTFHASVEGLSMFLVALTVSMLVYSSALYYAEVKSRHYTPSPCHYTPSPCHYTPRQSLLRRGQRARLADREHPGRLLVGHHHHDDDRSTVFV